MNNLFHLRKDKKEQQDHEVSEHHEETQPDIPEDAAPEAPDIQDEPAACQTTEHLKSYPIINETSTFVNEFAITKAAINSSIPIIKPIAEFIHSQSLLKPIVQTVDNFGNSTLNSVESVAPCLKTATWEDVLVSIKTPIVQTDEAIKDAFTATGDCMENNLIAPTRRFVRNGRAYYNEKLYDTKGKPLLRSSLDPVFRPVNYHMENFTLTNLPEGEPVMVEYSSEVERNVYLSMNLIERAIPVMGNKVVECLMVPCNYTIHVFDVYNDNLDKIEPSFNSSIKATYNTSVDLTNEAISETTTLWKKVWNGKSEEVEEPAGEVIETRITEEEPVVACMEQPTEPVPVAA